MDDICDLILQQHHDMRRRFAELDDYLAAAHPDTGALSRVWEALHRLLDAHAEAEELLFYPLLLGSALDAEAEAEADARDAIGDHNQIRDAGAAAARCALASPQWWSAVLEAREHNSKHMAEEERGALSVARTATPRQARLEAGSHWEAFMTGRLRELAEASHDKNPDAYVAAYAGGEA